MIDGELMPQGDEFICIARRDRNQVKTDARRTETMGGMIGDLILKGE